MGQTQEVSERRPECTIFVSRKTADREVLGGSDAINRALERLCPQLHFCDADDFEPGVEWLAQIRSSISSANILLLVLTHPSQNDFDWPLYEAGLFDGAATDSRRLVCLYPKGSKPPAQVRHYQAVEATTPEILKLLMKLFHDAEFTNTVNPLNERLEESNLVGFAESICAGINGRPGDGIISYNYVSRYIQLVLPPGVNELNEEVKVRSDEGSLKSLFGLENKSDLRWPRLIESVGLGDEDPNNFNLRWSNSVADVVLALRNGEACTQIEGSMIGHDKRVYSPQIEVWRTYYNDEIRIDLSFSERPTESQLRQAKAPIALAANLNLASRIRHELIETYRKQIFFWRTHTNNRARGFEALSDLFDAIEHDGFFIEYLTQGSLANAFHEKDFEELDAIHTEYSEIIRPAILDAVETKNVASLRKSLDCWKLNNARFFSIGIPRYYDLLELKEGNVLPESGISV